MATGSETDSSLNPAAMSRTVLETIANSLSVQLVLLGIAFVVAGYLKQFGPLAAMFAVWGAAFVLLGVASYLAVWKTRY